MLKFELESIEGLPADVAKEYAAVEENGKKTYRLQADGIPDVAALVRAREYEKKARQDSEAREKAATAAHAAALAAVEEERDGLRTGSLPKADVEAYKKSQAEVAARRDAESQAKFTAEVGKRDRAIHAMLVEAEALKIAREISTAPKLMALQIEKRLTVEEVDGVYLTKVVGPDGKPSAFTLDDLKKELKADPDNASVIVGSRASGGGASGSNGGGKGAMGGGGTDWSKADPNKLKGPALVEWTKWSAENKKAKAAERAAKDAAAGA